MYKMNLLSQLSAICLNTTTALISAGYILGYLTHGLRNSLWWQSITEYHYSPRTLMYYVNVKTETDVFNLYCTSSAWGFKETMIFNNILLLLIIFYSIKEALIKKKSTSWNALKILMTITGFLTHLSLVIDSISTLREKAKIEFDNTVNIFSLNRSAKVKIFVRLAHSHLVLYAIIVLFILMTFLEKYKLTFNTKNSSRGEVKPKKN